MVSGRERHRRFHTQGVDVVLVLDSPMSAALHAYDTEVALRALADPDPATPKEPTMTTVHSAPVVPAEAATLQQQVNSLAAKLQRAWEDLVSLHNDLSEQQGLVLDQQDRIERLEAQVEALENPQPKSSRDEPNQHICRYLRESVPGVWMTPGTVAANTGMDSKSVAGRLERLASLPGTGVERVGGRGTGRQPLYRIAPPPAPKPDSEA